MPAFADSTVPDRPGVGSGGIAGPAGQRAQINCARTGRAGWSGVWTGGHMSTGPRVRRAIDI